MTVNLDAITISERATLVEALHVIDHGGLQIALAIDEQRALRGVLTDGDVRRALLRGVKLDAPVTEAMNPRPIILRRGEDARRKIEQAQLSGMRHLPVVDEQGRLLELKLLAAFPHRHPDYAVLMAGGFGTRLRPLTDIVPKPLLRVNNKPILEHIICHFRDQGIRRFYLSVHYMADLIKAHFGGGQSMGVEIAYLDETTKLGTAGSLGLLPERPSAPFLVANGDVLTSVNLAQMVDFHIRNQAMMTVGAFAHDYQVPYGVLEMDNERIVKIEEKPIIRKYVSGGVYLLAPETMAYIHPDVPLDMPDLIQLLVDHRHRVIAFPIREYWLDVGRPGDLERAAADMNVEKRA